MLQFLKLLMVFALIFFGNLQAQIQVGIITSKGYCGEREVAWRIKIAGEKLGWKVFVDEDDGRALNERKGLDWVISLLMKNQFSCSDCPLYQTVFHTREFLDKNGALLPFYDKYDGFLFTIKNIDPVLNSFRLKNRELYSIPFYPTLDFVPYKVVELNHLVTMIPVWGTRLKSRKYRILYRLLSRTGFVKFYGVYENRKIIQDGYMGQIPFDGTSVVDVLQKHGIVLIIHSEDHNNNGIPSARVFEAAAASTVIISDQNPFVKEHFGDAVFYIDTTQSAKGICAQIQEHMNTIRLQPEKALDMAKTAHQIFVDNFLMSDQLLKLEALHQKIKLDKDSTHD